MKNKSKFWLLGLTTPAAALVPFIAMSCITPVWKKGKYVFEWNAQLDSKAFAYDASRMFGAYLASNTNQYTGGELFRVQGLNKAENFSELVGTKTEVYTSKPVFAKYKLELAQAIVLTDKDGKITVFDNDKVDAAPEANLTSPGGKKYYEYSTMFLESSDDKSINSKKFKESLNSAKTFQIVLRENQSWVNSKGEKTKYKIVAKDFWYSWLRTFLLNQVYRHENGGSQELDKKFQELLAENNTLAFTDKESFSNDYVYRLFNVDADKFFNQSDFITKISNASPSYQDKESLTFSSISLTEKTEFKSFFEKWAVGDYTLLPAPSQYIDELNNSKNQAIEKYSGLELSGQELKEYKEKLELMDHSKQAYFTGTYWYGNSFKTTLYAGHYYVSKAGNSQLVLTKNKHYWDESWVKDDTTIQEMVHTYQPTPLDQKIFSDTVFNKYNQGTASHLSYAQLSDSQKNTIANNPNKYGLRLKRSLNSDSPLYRMFSSPFVPGKKNEYGFSDAYAKMMWGATKEELKQGKVNPSTYISGTGLSFRTIINAAINWNTYASSLSSNQNHAWIAKIANGSLIGGKDQDTSKMKTPEDILDRINSLYAIDLNGNKIDFGGSLGKELSPSENDEAIKNKANTIDRLKSAGFNKLKEELQKLIDKFDNENPTLKDQEFQIYYLYPFVNASNTEINAWKELEKVFKELNPRLSIQVKYFNNDQDPLFNPYRFQTINGENNVAWSYDYNGIGSGYDGLSWGGMLIPTLVNIKNNPSQAIENNFPKLKELADELFEYEKTHKTTFSVPFDKLDQLESDRMTGQLFSYVISHFEFALKNGKYELQFENNKPKVFNPGAGKTITDPYEWSAKFWLHFNKNKTNEQLAEFMEQFTAFSNVNFTYNVSKSKEKYGKVLLNKHYELSDVDGLSYFQYQDWKINKGKK